MTPVLLATLLVVTVYRVTRLLVRDEFPPIRATREWILRTFAGADSDGNLVDNRWGPIGRSFAYLWTCPWCMSVWVGAGAVALADRWLSVPYPWLLIAASSAVTGWVNMLEVEHEQRVKLRDLQAQRMEAQR